MKRSKLYSLILLSLSFITLCSFFFVPTFAKFALELNAPFDGNSEVDYTVNEVFEVKNQEELFSAINKGYSYIQLSKDIENPLIVTQAPENLDRDLILDLNGIEIQRNGPEPILNIGEGIRLTITDTSTEQTGGLYNPIGSVFNLNGGTVSVSVGKFECGPRYSEYYSYNTYVLDANNDTTKRTVVESTARSVNYYTKGSSTATTQNAPIIRSYPTKKGDITYNHGNLYFDETITKGAVTINADTYCYYRTSEDNLGETSDPATADWYYTYYVKKDTYDYYRATLKKNDNADNYVQITIYGYEDIIATAKGIADVKDYYAAIQMQSGLLEVEKGNFFSYFGVDTTACVNANGGTLNIKQGKFSSRIPDAKSYSQYGVSVKEVDSDVLVDPYFDNFIWNDGGLLAQQGESYCILNNGNATVTVEKGDFCSSNNNVIRMGGGELSVGSGQFYKKHTQTFSSLLDSSSAIYMTDGQLQVNGAGFMVQGDYAVGVDMKNGLLNINNSTFSIEGSNTYGIYSTVAGNDNFYVVDTSISQTGGNNQIGIYSEGGMVHLSADLLSPKFFIEGSSSFGVYVSKGGSVSMSDYTLELKEENSKGIYSNGGSVSINRTSITLDSNNNCYGVYADASNTSNVVNIDIQNTSISVGYNDSTTKSNGSVIESSIGVVLISNNASNRISLFNSDIESYEIGVALSGGSLNFSGTGNIKTQKASSVAVLGGDLVFEDTSSYNLTSYNTTTTSSSNSYTLQVPYLVGTSVSKLDYENTDGIYVQGGALTANGILNVTHTGLQNPTDYSDFTGLTISSYAIRVVGGDVNILKGNITAEIGGGVYCSGGNITLGDNDSTSTDIYVSTLGQEMGDTYDAIGTYISDGWQSKKSITGGHAIELNGGDIVIYNGTFDAAFGNGVAANGNGKINIHDGIFNGWMGTGTNALTGKSGSAAFYGLKVVGGATVNIYKGTFDGGNGGAFITGIDTITYNSWGGISSIDGNEAYVYIYSATFGHSGTSIVDGFNVYDMATVIFGASAKNNAWSATDYQSAIRIYAQNAVIAANRLTYGYTGYIAPSIKIYYGTYSDCSYGIYNDFGNSADITVYNTSSSVQYTSYNGSYRANNTTPVYYA